MDEAVLNLAQASKKVTDLAYAAAEDRLSDISRLHRAMKDYDRNAAGYLGDLSPGDFVRADAERYGQPTRGALERVAQLLDREFVR